VFGALSVGTAASVDLRRDGSFSVALADGGPYRVVWSAEGFPDVDLGAVSAPATGLTLTVRLPR
jgi:hypothetical protein